MLTMIGRVIWLAGLWACHGRTTTVATPRAGLSTAGLNYRATGSGDPVVLIHAFQMDLREWDELAPSLARTRQVIRYDVRGHGRSRGVEGPYASHDELAGLLDELGIPRADIVGLSMGSTIALDFALVYPDRVRRVVAISPGVPGIRVDASREWMTPIMGAVRAGDGPRAAELWWASVMMAGTRERGVAGVRYRQVVLDNGRIWTQNPSAQRPLDPPAGRRLAELRAPLLVITGERDATGSVQQSDSIAARLPGVRRLTIPGAGHMISTERPAELLRAIERFLGEQRFDGAERGVSVPEVVGRR